MREIFLVHDQLESPWVRQNFLESSGFKVTPFESGRACLDALADHTPDLVLMDMLMPRLDGYDATRRARAQGHRLPILGVTANAMAGAREQCEDAGCSDYLSKPIQAQVLLETCARWVER